MDHTVPAQRTRLLAIAADLMAREGYERMSMGQLADAVDLSKSALYYHFSSKSDILYQITHSVAAGMVHRLESADAGPPPDERLRAVVEIVLRIVAEQRPETKVYLHEQPLLRKCLPRDQYREICDLERRFREGVVAILREGIEAGLFRRSDPKLMAFGIIGMVSWAVDWFDPAGAASVEDVVALFSAMALQGVQV